MQREKLYNFHKTINFTVAILVFHVAKTIFFLISSLFHLIFCIKQKKKTYRQMQHEKLHNLHQTAYFTVAVFVFKVLNDQFPRCKKMSFLVICQLMFYLKK